MLKNTKLKKFLKITIFKPINMLNQIFPKDDSLILLYSGNKGIKHNLKPLKEYLINHGYNKKYKLICGIEHMKYADKQAENVFFITPLKVIFFFLRAKHVFYTAGQIPIKPSAKQTVIHMQHGAANFKAGGSLTNINNGDEFFFTYMMIPSNIYAPITMKSYLCSEKNLIICGDLVTDIFFGAYEKYTLGCFDKIILWTPTFRQSDYLGYDDSMQEELLPMFLEEDYAELNEKLEELNFKMIVKLHPAQNTRKYKQLLFSNLQIYSHDDFISKNYDLYHLMPQVDVLISDYSSAFLHYLLLKDKQLAFVIPDYEEYRIRRGFVFDNPLEYMPGAKIKCKEELFEFFVCLKNGNDEYVEERERIRNLVYDYQDGNNCKRILAYSNIYL